MTATISTGTAGTATITRVQPYSRRISLTERSYLMAHLMAPPMAIQVFVEGRGALDPEQLAQAVAAASEACPGARVVRRGPNWVDGGKNPPVRVADGAGLDRTGYDSALFRTPFDPAAGPNCEVLLITGTPATLVFRAFHAVMDGKGMMTWITEVFRALRGQESVRATDTATEEDLVARFAKPDRVSEPIDTEARFTSPFEFFDIPDAGTASVDAGDDEAPGWIWRRRTIPGVHPALIARTAVAITRTTGAPGRFIVPVNLRRHDPALRSTANLTLPITVDVAPGTTWRAVQGRLVGAMMEGRELSADGPREGNVRLSSFAGLAPRLAAARAAGERRATYQATAILSELGRVDPAALSGGGFTAATVYSLPMYVPYAPAFFTVYQLPEHVELALSARRGPGAGARADALLDAIEAEFTDLAPTPSPATPPAPAPVRSRS
ncbi:MAG TPA: hypothetical protein VFU73_04910 [Actinocrinis sp.]|nr:hypothetical protein [Actinocrinis sp.]